MTDMTGTVALVTGASRGIGAATARHLAQNGAAVVLAARDAAALEGLVAEIEAAGGHAAAAACDVADQAQVAATVALAVERFGGLDLVVNNAGLIAPIARLEDSDPAAWSGAIGVNLTGAYHVLRAAIPAFRARGGGRVINLSSGAATSPLEGWSHYCVSKAGLAMLTRCIDKELAAEGITAIGLSPGTVATEMQTAIRASGVGPVSRLDWSAHIPPEWVAQAIAWLAGPGGDAWSGRDFSLKTDEGRALAGLPPLVAG